MRKTRNAFKVFCHRLELFIIVLFIFSLIIFIYWFLFISTYSQVRMIEIEGYSQSLSLWTDLYLQKINESRAPYWVRAFFPRYLRNNKSYLSFYYSDLGNTILKNDPKIEAVIINLDWKTGKLILEVKSRQIDYLWCLQKKLNSLESEVEKECYYLDKHGVIFEKAPKTSGTFLNKIVILEVKKRPLGSQVIPIDKLKKLGQLFTLSSQDNSPFSISYIEIKTESFSEINIVTKEGFKIFCNITDNFVQMIDIIQGIKENKFNKTFPYLEYIDYRYYPKVYIRT